MGRVARQAGTGSRLGFAAILVSTLGLAGCSDLDNQLFPGDETAAPAHPASTADNSTSSSSNGSSSDESAQPAPQASNEPPPATSEQPQPDSSQQAASESGDSGSDETFLDRLFGSDESDQEKPTPQPQNNAEESSSGGSWLDSLFGSDESEQRPAPQSNEQAAEGGPAAGGESPTYTPPGGAVMISPLEAAVVPIPIQGGQDTGTSVNKTIQSLRSQVADLGQKMMASASRTAELRGTIAREAAAYQSVTAAMVSRLQVGTTRGNPELVAQWNSAQSSLDELAGNINGMATLGVSLNTDDNNARRLVSQIQSTFDVSGAVDEDHRQLGILLEEANEVLGTTDRIFRSVSAQVRRQTSVVGTERLNLSNLEASIKDGDPYVGPAGRGFSMGAIPSGQYLVASDSGKPLVVIRFEHPDVDYQQILLAALNEALKTHPNASFKVVGIAPREHSARAVAVAQSTARRHAQAVLQTMTGMGVPAARLQVTAVTDPEASASEVRIFVL